MLSPVFTEYQGKRFVFFSSPHSDNGCLSNWYESGFSLDAHDFASAEQAFLYLKALSSNDEATALRVFAMNDPHYFARLNHQIRPFDARRWAQRREAAMRQIVHEKFAQSDELKDFLLATEDATIVNCSKNPLWSCGLQMTQVERLDQDRWMGQNLLGQILMDLRLEFRPPEPEPEPVAEEPAEGQAVADEDQATAAPAEAPTPDTSDVQAPTEPATESEQAGQEAATTEEDASKEASPEPASDVTPSEDAPSSDETVLMPQMTEPASADETVLMTDGQKTQLMAETAPAAQAQPEPEPEAVPAPQADADATGQLPTTDETPAASGSPEATTPAPTATPTTGDTIVDRYQQGRFPTAEELADGTILKGLMGAFAREDSAAIRQALMQCLHDSTVAVTAVKVDPVVAATAPVRDDGLADPLIMDNGSTYRPSILENDAGQRWFPAFSSTSEISEQISGQTSVIMLPMAQCVDIARKHGGLAGIVVNVFTDNLILPGRTCDYIAGLPTDTTA